MDGVIVNSEPVHQRLEFEMFNDLGLTISAEEHKDYVGTSAVDMWRLISTRHTLQKSPEELLLYGRQLYWDALDNGEVKLVEGVLDLIQLFDLQEFTLQVASSATRPTVEKVLDSFDLQRFFPHRIGGDEVKRSKPNPEIFQKAAKQSNSRPDSCLVIEDSSNGVKAAKKAGMQCIGYSNPGTGIQDLSMADFIIHDMEEITLDLLHKLS